MILPATGSILMAKHFTNHLYKQFNIHMSLNRWNLSASLTVGSKVMIPKLIILMSKVIK
jgi:hypothetical protein